MKKFSQENDCETLENLSPCYTQWALRKHLVSLGSIDLDFRKPSRVYFTRLGFVLYSDKAGRSSELYISNSFLIIISITHSSEGWIRSDVRLDSWRSDTRDFKIEQPRPACQEVLNFELEAHSPLYNSQPDLSDSEPLPTDRQSSWYVPTALVCDDRRTPLLTLIKPPAGKQKKKWSKGKGTRTPSSILRAHRTQP